MPRCCPPWERRHALALPRVQISVGALEDDPPSGKVPPELRALPGAAGRVAFHELAGENHGSVWLPAMTRGMPLFLEQPAGPGPAQPSRPP
jgi:uncharacterized protein